MGFSFVTGEETIVFADNVSFNGTKRGGKITTDGQLLIGSTTSPHLKVGSLASSDASVVITVGSGTIDLKAGAVVPTTFTTDSGNAQPSSHIIKVLGDHGLNTTGSGNIVTVLIDNAITLGDLSGIAAGSDALTCTTGDITLSQGNIELAQNTSADIGVVKINGQRLISSYGSVNNFFGVNAGNFTNSASENTGVGDSSLQSLTSGLRNSGLGNSSGKLITSGLDNTAMGAYALQTNATANDNAAFGSYALNLNTGAQNTAIGQSSLKTVSTGTNNTALGYASGLNLDTGTHNCLIGNSTGTAYTTTESSNILIMNAGTVADANTIRIGTQGTGAGQQDTTFIAGITGVTVAGTAPIGVDANGQLSSLGFGTANQVLTSNGAATSPTWQDASSGTGNLCFNWLGSPNNGTLADATTYYVRSGGTTDASTSSAPVTFQMIPVDGVITACSGYIQFAGTPTNENATLSIRINDTTSTVVSSTIDFTAGSPLIITNTALNIAVSAGDRVDLTFETPTWTTNPTSNKWNFSISGTT